MVHEKLPGLAVLGSPPPLRPAKPLLMYTDSFTFSDSNKTSPESLHAKPWPSRPQMLYKGLGGARLWDSSLDIIMLLVPIPFFTLAVAIMAVNGKPVHDRDLGLLQGSIKGTTTLFPICFAAIIGRASVKYATWKLEQGTTLGLLELLIGSRTVVSAVTTQIQLRAFNFAGLALILVWSLSPLGGQAILHVLFTPMQQTSVTKDISYWNLRQQSYSAPGGSFHTIWYPGFSSLLQFGLLGAPSSKTGPMDSWGNVKIPLLSSLISQGGVQGSDGWIYAPSNDSVTYSSLFGLPLSGIVEGNTTLTVETSYMEFECTNMTVGPLFDSANNTVGLQISPSGPFVGTTWNSELPWQIGYEGPDVSTIALQSDQSFISPSFCPDCLPSSNLNAAVTSGTLLYQEFDGANSITSFYCTPTQVYVESTVLCNNDTRGQICQVTAQRPSRLPHMPPELTYLGFPQVALGLSTLLIQTQAITAVNFIQNYLVNPVDELRILSGDISTVREEGPGLTPLVGLTLEQFGDRLGQIINAYMHASMYNSTPSFLNPDSYHDILAVPTGGNNASFVPASSSDIYAMIQNQTAVFTVAGILSTSAAVYFASYPWLLVFLLANCVMLSAAIAGIYYSRKTIVPEYLGFVSSLAKESPYIKMPDAGVNMDGMRKARMVKEVKVRLGDVSEGRDGVGRLAFARQEETKLVKKGRMYV